MNARLRPAAPAWQRPMTPADLEAVLALEVQAYSHPWTRGNFIDSLAAGYHAELRLDEHSRLLGYLVALPGFEETHLLNLTVAPAHQRAGHGSAMLAGLIQQASTRGDQALWLEVRPSNQPAQLLYQRLGFVEVGRRRDYYPAERAQREDALVLRRGLPVAEQAAGSQDRSGGVHGALV